MILRETVRQEKDAHELLKKRRPPDVAKNKSLDKYVAVSGGLPQCSLLAPDTFRETLC